VTGTGLDRREAAGSGSRSYGCCKRFQSGRDRHSRCERYGNRAPARLRVVSA